MNALTATVSTAIRSTSSKLRPPVQIKTDTHPYSTQTQRETVRAFPRKALTKEPRNLCLPASYITSKISQRLRAPRKIPPESKANPTYSIDPPAPAEPAIITSSLSKLPQTSPQAAACELTHPSLLHLFLFPISSPGVDPAVDLSPPA